MRIREIEALGYRGYGQRYEFTHTVPAILAEYGAKTAEELTPEVRARIAGRLMTLRHMGKAGFAHVQQNGERLQIYVKKDAVGEKDFALFKLLDIGDIVGVEGVRDAGAHRFIAAPPTGGARVHRSGDADDAAALRRGHGAPVRDAPQYARYRPLPAHRAGTLFEAAGGGRP